MSERIDRLVRLAQKTGDRLIIHDPEAAKDVVIMDIDAYEQLALGRNRVQRLTEEELIAQINEDICVWKENRTNDEAERLGEKLIDQIIHQPSLDPFAEDFRTEEAWHSVADVMKENYGIEFSPSVEKEEEAVFHNEDDIKYAETLGVGEQQASEEDLEQLRYEVPVEEESPVHIVQEMNTRQVQAIQAEPEKEEDTRQAIPQREEKAPVFVPQQRQERPIFLEEPL